jgi:DNA (cytosine-5)-methyltransferase 1
MNDSTGKITSKMKSVVTSTLIDQPEGASPYEATGVPVIDLFAGPGGLGEGFASAGFEVALSCEMDPIACETLRLRKFYHLFDKVEVPDEYYQFIKGEISQDDLKEAHPDQFEKAFEKVMQVELGSDSTRREVHRRIRDTLADFTNSDSFVLVGGPPCQAYSLAGRSRRLGGHPVDVETGERISAEELSREANDAIRERAREFYEDPKHTLYMEYLEIIAIHRPALFVMENVKGMTSAKRLDADGDANITIFDKVMSDLEAPANSIKDKEHVKELSDEFDLDLDTEYRLVTLSHEDADALLPEMISRSGKEFILKSEDYGIPQARHRVFVVGIRNDVSGRPATLSRKSTVNVEQVISKMPKLRSGLSKTLDTSENWAGKISHEYAERLEGEAPETLKLGEYVSCITTNAGNLNRGGAFVQYDDDRSLPEEEPHEIMRWLRDDRIGGVIQHQTRGHISSDLVRYLFCSAYALHSPEKKSPKIQDWPTEKLRPDHNNIKINTLGSNGPRLKTSTHSDRFRVQVWHKPATTVVSHISKDGHYFIHPDPEQCRSLTVREAARLQTFPDNYFFSGNRTQQYHQVGNAVPPLLAKQIAEKAWGFIVGLGKS